MRAARAMILAAAGALLATGPAAATGAAFDPVRFFDGRTASCGTVRTALVFAEPFTAAFSGRRRGAALVLDERFRFPDGNRLQRWRLAPDGAGGYQGSVETEGSSGRLHAPVPVRGTATAAGGVELRYDGFAPGGDAVLHFRHRMTPQGDGTVLNRVRVSKFGVPLAGARVVFRKVPGGAKCGKAEGTTESSRR